MKRLLSIFLAAICVIVLIAGQIHWKGKTAIPNKQEKAKEGKISETRDIAEEQRFEALLSFAANWPEEASTAFAQKLRKEEPYKIVFAGSEALGEGADSWPEIVAERMARTYGDVFDFAFLSYDLTSTEFVEQNKVQDLIKEEADLILLEPFTLNDNGRVVIETSLENIERIIDAVLDAKQDTVFLLQPPQPIYNASWYLFQLENLQRFAEQSGIPYLNHWEAWPDTKDPAINQYLTTDRSALNEEGHKLWAEFLIDYFIAN